MKTLLRQLMVKFVESRLVEDKLSERETAKRSAWPLLIKRCSPRT